MSAMPKCVLIVDDSTVSRMLLRKLIRERCPDWKIVEAADAEEALARSAETAPDLVTIDIGMPGMNGLELAQQLHVRHPQAKLAIVTANIQDSMHRKIQGLGILFVAVVDKPATAAAIDRMLYYADADD